MRDLINLTEEQEALARRLHAGSTVVNVYGGPFSAPRSIRRWRTGHLSGDAWTPPVDDAVRQYLVPDMRAGGVDCVIAAAFTHSDLGLWLREFQTSYPPARLAVTAEEVRRAKREGELSFLLCAGGAVERDAENAINAIILYHRAGVRVWSLTHSNRNLISDGIGEPAGAGLSRLGRLIVKELNRQRILVDISHISDNGFWDVMDTSLAPIIATHSNCRSLCQHERNLTDEMIKAIAESGGIVALNFFPHFVRPEQPTVFDLIDHIVHIGDLVGLEHVALGPDFCAGRWDWILPSWWRRGSSDHNARSMAVEYPAGVEDITKMSNMTRALVARGFDDSEIEGVLGGNFLRLFEQVAG